MKRKLFKMVISFLLSITFLIGCQKAPEVSKDGEILRAKGASESAIESIVEGEGKETEGTEQEVETYPAESVDIVLGEGENRMKITAEVPAVPKTLRTLTMRADSRINEDMMRKFLEPQKDVKDITQKKLDEMAAERARVEKQDKKTGESSIVERRGIRDESYFAFTDGNREAEFGGRMNVKYVDNQLREKYLAAVNRAGQNADVEVNIKEEHAGNPSFSLQEAKTLLLRKLSALGISGIRLTKAYVCEEGNLVRYQIQFTPVIEGIGVADSFGQQSIDGIYPQGMAWVGTEGAVWIELYEFCMETASVSGEKPIINFEKVKQLLVPYLNNGSLQCKESVPFRTAELVWYPAFDGETLKLVPTWSVHMDLDEYVDYKGEDRSENWTIFIDAVTGELKGVQ